ncbi:hypothetical protein [Paractinoplanes abujensis]|uniref:Uncharacterized protein n=1 Tax=Paractinoplanes abujensis TaxID=882441 RepID=A0A7W7CK29_9ACTN|nr:hypothetical protein [Actinoplanes abujensis]MBB4689968.1 hypothetical protein [Actinoplanes abujensis]
MTLLGGLTGLSEDGKLGDMADLGGRLEFSCGTGDDVFTLIGEFRRHSTEVSAGFAWGTRSQEVE